MIPISLSIEGLYSYRQKQIIEFDRLNKARLFGVFGAVGSGKSTLLEAITLALYGQCERLDNRDNKNYNLMNLASNKLYVSFEFEHSGKKYQFNYGNKRNSKNFDEVKSPERSAFEWDNEVWQPLASSDAELVLGLSYDNFRRTIIIPQGKFQEFLQLGDAERTRMVKDMFSLERFEFYNKTDQLYQHTQLELAGLTGNLQELEQYSEEAELKLKADLIELKDKGTEARKKLDSIKMEFEKANEARKLDAIWKEKKVIHIKAQERLPELNGMIEKLNRYKNANQTFAVELQQVKKLQTQHEESKRKLSLYSKQISDINQHLDELRMANQNLQKSKKEQMVWLKEKAELERLADFKILLPKQTEWQQKIDLAQSNLEVIQTKLSENQYQEDQNEQLAQALKLQLEQKESLNQWLFWFDLKARLQKQSDDQKELFTKLEGQLNEYLIKQIDLLSQNNINQNHLLIDEIEVNNHKLERLIIEKDHLLKLSGLEQYASTLHDGEPCPLCGALEHPHIINSNEAQESLKLLENEIKIQKNKVDQLLYLDKQLATIQTQMQGLTNQKLEINERLIELNKELELQKSKEPKLTLEIIGFEEAQILLKKINEAESDFQALILKESARKEQLKQMLTHKEHEQQMLNTLLLEFQTIQTQLSELNKSWDIIHPENFMNTDAKELKRKSIELEKQQLDLANNMAQIESQIQKKDQELATILGSVKAQDQLHESIINELNSLSKGLESKLAKSDFLSFAEIESLLSESVDINDREAKINEWKLSIQKAKNDWEEAEQKAFQNPHQPENWEEISQTKIAQEELISELIGEFKAQQSALNNAIEKREKAQAVREKAEKLKVRLAYLSDLKNLFKASGFVRFVSQVYLENLCKQADQRFQKLTRHQLSLELDDKLNFVVRDFLHNGQLRSVKTLSGGQTFQASLSLALALSDSFNQFNAEKGHFFFMDEGFGSLDADSLKTVFDALQELRYENRIVGVISHLEELQKEIDTYLKITNLESQGSVVNVSWA